MIVTLIEKEEIFEVYGSDGKLVGTISPGVEILIGTSVRKSCWYWYISDYADGMERTLSRAIEVLTGYCPAGGVAIK